MTLEKGNFKEGINRTRAANFHKATMLRKAGFKTAVHALPLKVKSRLDQMLSWRHSVESALQQLSIEFPGVELPSIPSVYNYKEKYLEPSLYTPKSVLEKKLAMLNKQKTELGSLLMTEIKRFIAYDLPVLHDRAVQGLEIEHKLGIGSRNTNDQYFLYMKGIELGTTFLDKLGIKLIVQEEGQLEIGFDEMVEGAEDGLRKESLDERLARIFAKRGSRLLVRTSKTTRISA